MALPTYVAVGTAAEGVGDVTPAWPGGAASGDIGFLVVETANEAVAAPSGWTEITNSPQGSASAPTCRLTIFQKTHSGSESSPTVTDPGNHALAVIVACRHASGTPVIHQSSGGVTENGNGTMTATGFTTTLNDGLILIFAGKGSDNLLAGPFSNWTNANLANITERYDVFTIEGNGGAFALATGEKATAGSIGSTTATFGSGSDVSPIPWIVVGLVPPGQSFSLPVATETDTAAQMQRVYELPVVEESDEALSIFAQSTSYTLPVAIETDEALEIVVRSIGLNPVTPSALTLSAHAPAGSLTLTADTDGDGPTLTPA